MIFVTLGTQDKEFSRLISIVQDYLITSKNHDEKIVIQYGNTKVRKSMFEEFSNVELYDFLSPNKFEKFIKEADVIVTHAGVGTIIQGLNNGKKLIVVPRLKKYKEHVNDHQLQITENFSENGYIIPLYDGDNLETKIEEANGNFKPKEFHSNNEKFNDSLEKIIDNI